ncbi:MAG TPA: hypothetical protein VN894_05895 [Polyangiaceae bacterium]|nr:hypothetical protein [Polyangiaceae bacterium]
MKRTGSDSVHFSVKGIEVETGRLNRDVGPARPIRDRDKIFGAAFDRRVDNLGLTQLRIAPRSPCHHRYRRIAA